MPELNPDQSIVSEEIDSSKILIHIAQLVRNCFASCKAIQFYTMSFHFFSSGFDKKTPVLDLENFPLWQPM
jgi:hypothetical protein